MPEHVREGGEQLAVLELHGVRGQDGRVLELGGYLGEVLRAAVPNAALAFRR